MPLLDGTIAFALCLAGFATIVTLLVEALHRALRLRPRGQREMLEHVFANVLAPVMAQEKIGAKDWAREMMKSPLAASALSLRYPALFSADHDMTTAELIERLGRYGPFKAAIDKAKLDADVLLNKAAQAYEEYGAAMSDYFKRRAQFVSVVAGILLAAFANIDGLRMFERFTRDPAAAARVESQVGALEQSLRARPAADADSFAQVRQDANRALAALRSYRDDAGLPIGWMFFPGCAAGEAAAALDARCGDLKSESAVDNVQRAAASLSPEFLTWVFVVLVTGFLIGLGGPFWFDVAKKLASVRDAVRGTVAPPAVPVTPPVDDKTAQVIADIRSKERT